MIVGRVYAMGRPRRPVSERQAVRQAVVGTHGSNAQRAARLAAIVAQGALQHLDGDPVRRLVSLLALLSSSPTAQLIADADIDTAAAFRAERAVRAEARGWRRLSEAEANEEDRQILAAVTELLRKRYVRALVGFHS